MSSKRIVVKVGTSVLTGGSRRLDRPHMVELARQCAQLIKQGHEVLLCSSGAIAAGRERLRKQDAPTSMAEKQMLAAVGQCRLMAAWDDLFDLFDVQVGQVLLTRADVESRDRFLNARDTLQALLKQGILPILNENDAVATEEIKVGDNDNLSALAATLCEADLLLLLTDIDGLYSANPHHDPEARLLHEVSVIDPALREIAGGSVSGLGTGGMMTKIEAAEIAQRMGTEVVIASGREPDVILRLAQGQRIGTRFVPGADRLEQRKRWILAGPRPQAGLIVDEGAVKALTQQKRSLLSSGILSVSGSFQRGDTIHIYRTDQSPCARGITRYPSQDVEQICGKHSEQISTILGHSYGAAVIHRNDMILLSPQEHQR